MLVFLDPVVMAYFLRMSFVSPTFLSVVLFLLISSMVSIILHDPKPRPANYSLLQDLRDLDLPPAATISKATERASTDFGRLIWAVPAAVLYPSSEQDIASLVQFAYSSPRPFTIAPRGNGHSVRGQALAAGGVVVEMTAMGDDHFLAGGGGGRINVFVGSPLSYVDAGGEQQWVDVLRETLKHGLAPRSWTDYLHLTVGGTLSNAGISGQTFLHGPQISNVLELDVITGKGERVTCSEHKEAELFFAVLGGLGQFGIITRARIPLETAPQMVKWMRLIYTDVEEFTRDQEILISLEDRGFDYLEGFVLMESSLPENSSSSFYSKNELQRLRDLAAQFGTVYCLEVAKNYDHPQTLCVEQEVKSLLKDLSFVPELEFKHEVTYVKFLNRVHEGEVKLRSRGLWKVPHPWLNLFIPRSRILDFDRGVFKQILKQASSSSMQGPILIYPVHRNKWVERMSAVIPDEEEMFYSVGLLRCGMGNLKALEDQNREILRFCDDAGIKYKLYLPYHTTQDSWKMHFGPKWHAFLQRKIKFDPKLLLSPGQNIFTTSPSPIY